MPYALRASSHALGLLDFLHTLMEGKYILLRRIYVRLAPTADENTHNPRFRFTPKTLKYNALRFKSKLSRARHLYFSLPCAQGKRAFLRVLSEGTYHKAEYSQ